MELKRIIDMLSKKRPLFHSEADFKFALALEIQEFYSDVDIRLEYPVVTDSRECLDILVKYHGDVYPIELKYKTKKLSLVLNDESYHLKSHGAQDFGSYDFVKDICRLESFSKNICGYKNGFAIWLTNDSYYWNPPRKSNTGAAAFRVYNGSKKSGKLTWGNTMTNTRGREQPLFLENEYEVSWLDYSRVAHYDAGTFKYVVISV